MSVDTTSINRSSRLFAGSKRVWLFGYGSLIYKADFPFIERRSANVDGWQRRFWQGSHDHRGTPAAPGRVVTLVPAAGVRCRGMAYLIEPEVFAHLDHREKNGYLRCRIDLDFDDGTHAPGLVYVATETNAAFLGPAPDADIAAQIAGAAGPSGSNREYLLRLAAALRELGADDAHVFALERLLREREENAVSAAAG